MPRLLRLLLLPALFSGLLAAQNSGLSGLVTDPSGAVVPAAAVTVINQKTNVKRKTVSNGEGRYDAPGLELGIYSVRVEKNGFTTVEKTGIDLPVDTVARVDIGLTPGTLGQVLTVTAANEDLRPDSPELSTSITSAKYDDLPLAQAGRLRNPATFVYLAPGVQGNIRLDGNEYTGATNVIAVHGSNIWSTELLIEGLPGGQTRIVGNYTESSPAVDAVAEFKITTTLLPADYGHTGPAVGSFAVKSGTNQLHASAYEYLRNNKLDANNWYANKTGAIHPPTRQNEFGGTLGGPVTLPRIYQGKDRTFFFFSYGASRKTGSDAFTLTQVPTAKQLGGDFSGGSKIYDPNSNQLNPAGSGYIRTLFPNNVIPVSQQDPVARKIVAYYPQPNALGVNNYGTYTGEKLLNPDTYTAKLDHTLAPNQLFSAAYVRTYIPRLRLDSAMPDPLTAGIHQFVGSHTARLGYEWIVSPRAVNEFKAGYNRFTNNQDPINPGDNFPQVLGISGLTGGSFPSMSFTNGYATIGNITRSRQSENDFYYRDTFRISIGRHALRAGGEFRRTQYNDTTPYEQTYSIAYNSLETADPQNTASTGNGFASFLLGAAHSATVTNPFSSYTRKSYAGAFVQDDWRLNSHLTLNFGLRLEKSFAPTEAQGHSSIVNLSSPNAAAGNLPGAFTTGGGLFPSTPSAWSPRFGFAYSLTKETVLRGGYGLYYSDILPNTSIPVTGFQIVNTYSSPNNGVTPAFYLKSGVPPGTVTSANLSGGLLNGQNASYYASNVGNMPRTQQWSLTLQRQLTSKTFVEVAYIGSHSTGQTDPQLANINQLDPKYLALGTLLTQTANSAAAVAAGIKLPYAGFSGSVAQALRAYPQYLTLTSVAAKAGASKYNALEVILRKKSSFGLSTEVTYTKSKATGFANVTLGGNSGTDNILQNAYVTANEWSLLPQDVPQAVTINTVYELPFQFHNRILNGVARGWKLSAVQRYQSGFPFSITTKNTLAIFNRVLRPNILPGVDPSTHISNNSFDPSVNSVFNKAAFSNPVNTFGTAAPTYGNLRNFPVLSEDLGLVKQTKLAERLVWTFYCQAFNPFNRHRFAGIDTNFSNATFGVPAATSQARIVQFGTRFLF